MKQIRIIFLCMSSLCLLMPVHAQTAKDAFLSMPEGLLPDLHTYSRMDLIDLYNAGQEAVAINNFNDSLVLENLTRDYLCLNTGKGSLQIIVLQMINESQLYCFIRTVCGPVCDSRIEFYSTTWNRLKTETFITPAAQTEFITINPDFPALDISLMQWRYDPENAVLQQICNTPQYLSREDRKSLEPFIKEKAIHFRWNGIGFELFHS